MELYRAYSSYLKEKYGEKVYKLPVNLPVTCPNRDGRIGTGGCIFCGETGAGFESLSNQLSVKQQLEQNAAYIGKRYNAKKFIAFFQNFTNTYLPVARFQDYLWETNLPSVVETAVSTRPDCVSECYLKKLAEFRERTGKEVSLELGLQTANYHTLRKLNRGHTLAEFLDACRQAASFAIPVCVHVILDLPWDDMDDVTETAKIISAMKVSAVKMHSLYLVKNTVCAQMYQEGAFHLRSKEEYIERVIVFLEQLAPDIVIERIIGRAPAEDTLVANFHTGWWKIKKELEEKMRSEARFQGRLFHYLGGEKTKWTEP